MSGKKIVGLFILVVLLLPILAAFSLKARYNASLEAEISAMKARGEPTTPSDLMNPRIPDSENGAAVYKKLKKVMSAASYKNDDLVISNMLSTNTKFVWSECRDAVNRHQDLMKIVEEAVAKPKCRFSLDWSKAWAINYTYLSEIRHAEKFCCASACVNAKCGNMDMAVRNLQAGYGMAESQRDEPSKIPQECRLGCHAILSKALHTSLELGDINERQAKILFDTLQNIDPAQGFRKLIDGARVEFIVDMGPLAAECDDFIASRGDLPSFVYSKAGLRISSVAYQHIAMKGDMAYYLRLADVYRNATKMTYAEAKKKGLLDEPMNMPFFAIMSMSQLFGRFDRQLMENYLWKCQICGDQVYLALAAYKARYGCYPQTYSDLRTRLGWKLPRDPFSDKDFIYRPKRNGFILYSVGPNMKDDGGVQRNKKPFVKDETGDYVWKMSK